MRRLPSVERFALSLLLALGLPACDDDATSGPLILDATTAADTQATATDTQATSAADTQATATDTQTTSPPDTSDDDTATQDTTAADTATEDTTAADTATQDTTAADTATEDTTAADTATEDTTAADTSDPSDTSDVVEPSRCGDSTPLLIAGQDTGFAQCESGAVHRVAAKACVDLTPRSGRCEGGDGGGCVMDADCPSHATCDASDWSFGMCYCTPGCVTDSDCGEGQICECGDPIGRCVAADCVTDADCGPGLLCVRQGGCYGEGAFTCQTLEDTCDDPSDCGDPTWGPFCQKLGGEGPLQCVDGGCAVPGRPFLVEDEARLAAVEARGDWQAQGLAPRLEGLTWGEREQLAGHWARVGLMEHASVAAFARSAMQLMALGAPPALLIDTQAAMADELRHAQQAFALASAYAGQPVGPGPLRMDGALGRADLAEVLRVTVEEGCVGESVAAVEAAEAAAQVEDAVVRGVLEGIAADEGRHAALAWRTVQWAVEVGGEAARALAASLLAEAVAAGDASPGAVTAQDAAAARLGMVGGSLGAEVKRQALRYAVGPCAARLLTRSALDGAARSTQPPAVA